MVSRNTLECAGCCARTITRTQIGFGDSQVHSFQCETCGTGITFVVRLDQKAISIAYDQNPTNARWVDTEEGAEHTIAFVTELLIPRFALRAPMGITPFMSAFHLFSDWEKFSEDQRHRRDWASQAPPVLSRVRNHLEQRNAKLFAKDVEHFGRQCAETASDIDRLRLVGTLERVPGNLMALPRPGWFDRIHQRLAYAWAKDASLVRGFVAASLANGRSRQLWHELASLSEHFAQRYAFVTPLLQPNYWKEQPLDLSAFVVCDKRFAELKQLYVDAFETACRLSTIAIALEAISLNGSLEIPTKKGSLTVWEYDALPNANKSAHLEKYPVADMFVPFLDTTLRNGIGHNTARYDAGSDDVVWAVKAGAGSTVHRLPYTQFVKAVLEMCSTLAHIQEYFYAVHVRAEAMPV